MEEPGFEPGASRMQSERSTAELHPLLASVVTNCGVNLVLDINAEALATLEKEEANIQTAVLDVCDAAAINRSGGWQLGIYRGDLIKVLTCFSIKKLATDPQAIQEAFHVGNSMYY